MQKWALGSCSTACIKYFKSLTFSFKTATHRSLGEGRHILNAVGTGCRIWKSTCGVPTNEQTKYSALMNERHDIEK